MKRTKYRVKYNYDQFKLIEANTETVLSLC